VKIDAQSGLTISFAEVSGDHLELKASEGQPIKQLAGAKVSLR
jgi:hypothetical protein